MTPRPETAPHLSALIERRTLLRVAASAALTAGVVPVALAGSRARGQGQQERPAPSFEELPNRLGKNHAVAPGHTSQVLVRWGDPVAGDAPAFDPASQSIESQRKQFGHGSDFIAFLPLPLGSDSSDHGLLWVNHEHTVDRLMFPDHDPERPNALHERIELEAVGGSVLEVRREGSVWSVVDGSKYNRRITGTTPCRVSGPAAGHPRMRTSDDRSGERILGTLGNCGGGVTPWGTVLTAEENIQDVFRGDLDRLGDERREQLERYNFGRPWMPLSQGYERFHLNAEPNEPNRFGWIVEVDPHDPFAAPIKRTALGRFAHEAASCVVDPSGRLVVYMGDDAYDEYLYRYVSNGTVNTEDRAANRALLDDGVLFVARFNGDSTLTWLPLIHGQGPLTAENGFESQADVVIDVRAAADLLGATPMDRPEDVDPHPSTGDVYLVLTKNHRRGTPEGPELDAANPRAENRDGHLIQLAPPGGRGNRQHIADTFMWRVFLMAGPEERGGRYPAEPSGDGWFSCPDNLAFDVAGRMWIATDGNESANGLPDGLWMLDPARGGAPTHFFAVPMGAECTGPCFTPDGTTLFVSVQHPALNSGSSYARPSTRWPDFSDALPPRPAVVALRREDGGPIGSPKA
jgi:secreted PhoX family phosphatase